MKYKIILKATGQTLAETCDKIAINEEEEAK